MLNLLKYEFCKTMFSKMILLVITGLAELAFLAGIFINNDTALAWGITGLFLCAVFGILYIGVESLICFHRDLNTKQSYMLFLTPNSSYRILGAKVLENGLSILVVGACFAGLAVLDGAIAMLHIGGLKQIIRIIEDVSNITIDWNSSAKNLIAGFAMMLSSWIMTVTTGYMAILISATVLAGKKLSGFVSFLVYLIITYVIGVITDRITGFLPPSISAVNQFCVIIGLMLLFSAAMYGITGWVMERKLSV